MNKLIKNWHSRALHGAAILACGLGLLFSADVTPASATAYTFNWNVGPGQQYALGAEVNYRSSSVWGQDWVAAGAHYPGGWSLYGGYVIGFTYACHAYAAGNTLGGMMQNASVSLTQSMTITEYYNWGQAPAC